MSKNKKLPKFKTVNELLVDKRTEREELLKKQKRDDALVIMGEIKGLKDARKLALEGIKKLDEDLTGTVEAWKKDIVSTKDLHERIIRLQGGRDTLSIMFNINPCEVYGKKE